MIPGGEQRRDGADERDEAQYFLALFFVDQRVEHHDQHAEDRENRFSGRMRM